MFLNDQKGLLLYYQKIYSKAMEQLPSFIMTKSIACLCTCDKEGNPSGATIFYVVKDDKIYILTHEQSLKVKHIKANPKVCFVVVDEIDYHQVQLYAEATIVDNPGDYIPLIKKAIEAHSENTNEMIPYNDIKNEGNNPVVIQLMPKNSKRFRSGEGLTES